jgi:hypothetical protein
MTALRIVLDILRAPFVLLYRTLTIKLPPEVGVAAWCALFALVIAPALWAALWATL